MPLGCYGLCYAGALQSLRAYTALRPVADQCGRFARGCRHERPQSAGFWTGACDAGRLGVSAECGLSEAEAQELNIGFVSRMTRGRPWVRMKLAASLDGKTALQNGTSQWITGPQARQDGHRWRARACAILSGIGTVRDDDPQLNVRGIEVSRQSLKVVVDSRLELPLKAKVLNGGGLFVGCLCAGHG